MYRVVGSWAPSDSSPGAWRVTTVTAALTTSSLVQHWPRKCVLQIGGQAFWVKQVGWVGLISCVSISSWTGIYFNLNKCFKYPIKKIVWLKKTLFWCHLLKQKKCISDHVANIHWQLRTVKKKHPPHAMPWFEMVIQILQADLKYWAHGVQISYSGWQHAGTITSVKFEQPIVV